MATAMPRESICSLVADVILELQTKAGSESVYNDVVLIEDRLLVIDESACNVQLYSRRDGKLLSTSHTLEDIPMDACLVSKTEVAVCLLNCKIVILTFKPVDDVKLVKTLDVSDVWTGFHAFDSVAKLNSDKLVVSGWKEYHGRMMCWGVVSITDGHLDSVHYIGEVYGFWSHTHLAIKNNIVYISCWTGDSTVSGVYAYDIFNPHTHKFLYQHKELKYPWTIMAERDCVFVVDMDHNRIHQLTDSGQLVTIHTVSSSPYGLFYDDQHRVIYTTSWKSKVITVYKMEYSHKTEKLHRIVLNRCLPELIKDLNVWMVMMYIQQNEVFDDVIIRDISEQKTSSHAISKLIQVIQQRDQYTYEQFKECLILAREADLKKMLEEEEAKLAPEIKGKHQGTALSTSEEKRRQQTTVVPTSVAETTHSSKAQSTATKASTTSASTTKAVVTTAHTTVELTTQSPSIQTSRTKPSATTEPVTKALATTTRKPTEKTTQSTNIQATDTKSSTDAASTLTSQANPAPSTEDSAIKVKQSKACYLM